MKPAEQIESIRILDLGGNGAGTGSSGGGMGKIIGSILQAGAALPMLKEIMNFADVNPQNLVNTVKEYVSGSNRGTETETAESTEEQV